MLPVDATVPAAGAMPSMSVVLLVGATSPPTSTAQATGGRVVRLGFSARDDWAADRLVALPGESAAAMRCCLRERRRR